MTLTWKSIDPTKVQAYNEDGRLTGIASRGFFETDWDAYLVWNIPRLYLGTWSSEELAKAAIERAAKTTLSGWKSHAENRRRVAEDPACLAGYLTGLKRAAEMLSPILEFASFPATETCVDPDPAGGEYEVRPVAEAVRAEAQKAIDRGANNKRIAELEAENARLREALERARNWVDFSACSLGAGVSSYAVAESLRHESARISADLSAPGLTDPQPAAGTEAQRG